MKHPGQLVWEGPFQSEGSAAFHRAIAAGMSLLRAFSLGNIGSFRDGWITRKTLALRARCSVRTVQRAITQARELGLLGVARAKRGETPPGMNRPLDCGFSHRWTVGWGKAGEQVKQAVALARAKYITRKYKTVAPAPIVPVVKPHRRWTAEELDAELAKRGH